MTKEREMKERLSEEVYCNGIDEFVKKNLHPLMLKMADKFNTLPSQDRNLAYDSIIMGLTEILKVKDTTRVMAGVRMMRRFSNDRWIRRIYEECRGNC